MDPISDLIIQIKNANAIGKETAVVPYSKMKEAVLVLLEKEGYIKSIEKRGKKIHKSIEIALAYDEYGPKVKGVERISKLSRRLYSGVKGLKPVMQGQGIMVLSTPKGIMSDFQARKEKVGGELLFKVW